MMHRVSLVLPLLLVACGGRVEPTSGETTSRADAGVDAAPLDGHPDDPRIDADLEDMRDPDPPRIDADTADTLGPDDAGDPDDPVIDAAPVDAAPSCNFLEVQNVLSRTCAVSGCHVLPAPPSGLVLSSPWSYKSLVWARSTSTSLYLVEPFHSESSYLYLRITARPGAGFAAMPPPGATSFPTSAERDLIKCWIDTGALP